MFSLCGINDVVYSIVGYYWSNKYLSFITSHVSSTAWFICPEERTLSFVGHFTNHFFASACLVVGWLWVADSTVPSSQQASEVCHCLPVPSGSHRLEYEVCVVEKWPLLSLSDLCLSWSIKLGASIKCVVLDDVIKLDLNDKYSFFKIYSWWESSLGFLKGVNLPSRLTHYCF